MLNHEQIISITLEQRNKLLQKLSYYAYNDRNKILIMLIYQNGVF